MPQFSPKDAAGIEDVEHSLFLQTKRHSIHLAYDDLPLVRTVDKASAVQAITLPFEGLNPQNPWHNPVTLGTLFRAF